AVEDGDHRRQGDVPHRRRRGRLPARAALPAEPGRHRDRQPRRIDRADLDQDPRPLRLPRRRGPRPAGLPRHPVRRQGRAGLDPQAPRRPRRQPRRRRPGPRLPGGAAAPALGRPRRRCRSRTGGGPRLGLRRPGRPPAALHPVRPGPPRGAGGRHRPAQGGRRRVRPLHRPPRPDAGRAAPPGLHPRADAAVVSTPGRRAAAAGGPGLLLVGGKPVPLAGLPLRIDEATPLAFALAPGVIGRLNLAGLPVPLVNGKADPVWVDESRREQWVGELDLELVTSEPQAAVLRPRVVVLPRRATVEGFGFLVDQFRAWAGPGALADPAGRTRIWAELAPRVPRREEERALVALALLRRTLPALAAIHRAPATAFAERREWSRIDRTAGRRLLMRRLHPFDPPRPVHEPRSGQVATLVVEPSTDRAE